VPVWSEVLASEPADCYAGTFWDVIEHLERALLGAGLEDKAIDPNPLVWRNLRALCKRRYDYVDAPE
jgi:hypothetical protein